MIIFFNEDHFEEIGNRKIRYPSNCLNRVLDIIARKMIERKPNENGYTEIYGFEFEKEYSNYYQYLDYLIRNKFIKRDYYIKEEKPFGYRFTEKFKEDVEIKNFVDTENKNTRLKVVDDGSMDYVKPWVKDRIRKDFMSARILFNPKENQIQKTKDEWNRFIDIRKWLHNNIVLNRWIQRNRFFKWKRNRLYNNFVVLSSVIRNKYIRLNKEELVEFDISSSFPLMLAKYCIQVNPGIVEDVDFKDYCTNLLNGNFYGELAKGLNSIRNCNSKGTIYDKDSRKISRDDAKLLYQVYLNGDYRRLATYNFSPVEIRNYMKMKYPSVHEIIKDLKERNVEVYDVLVEIESRLIFQIIEELYSMFDDIRILTCHDAIYVPKSFQTRVAEVWDKNMNSFTSGLPIEKIGTDNVLNEEGIIELVEIIEEHINPMESDEFLSDDENEDEFWHTPLRMSKCIR